jgi:hypothetical protein
MLVLFNGGIQFRACVPIMFTVLPHGVTTLKPNSLRVNWNVWQTSVGWYWNPVSTTCCVTNFKSQCAHNATNIIPLLSYYMKYCTGLQKIHVLTCNSITISSYFATVMNDYTHTAESSPMHHLSLDTHSAATLHLPTLHSSLQSPLVVSHSVL